MTALNRTPANTNNLQPTKFLLTFDRIPNTQYFCQSINIPGVNLGQAPIQTMMGDIYSPGNKITWNPLMVHFIIDEEMKSWTDLHNWFCSAADPGGFDKRNALSNVQNGDTTKKSKVYSDATLTILSSLNNPIFRVYFTNCFPITLSDVIFDTTQSADSIITGDAVFNYDYYDINPIKA